MACARHHMRRVVSNYRGLPMSVLANLRGMEFGRLIVIERVENSSNGRVQWRCQCECGGNKVVLAKHLQNGKARSCGCLYSDHGMSQTRIYKIWMGVRERCNNPKKREYPDYGGRGIKICIEWDNSFRAFQSWAEANGYQDNLTIDREKNDGDYEPRNCRWVTILVQANNKRGNHLLTFRGETKTISEFARQVGIKRVTVGNRIKANWTVERALTTAPRNWGR